VDRRDRDDQPRLRPERSSLASAAGGAADGGEHPDPAPDILRADGSAWLRTDRIPLACLDSLRSAWQITLADLPEITMPALLLRSTQDRVVPAAAQEEVLARIGSADVSEVLLPASGHLATLDHDAALIADEILAFVARVGGELAPSAGRAP